MGGWRLELRSGRSQASMDSGLRVEGLDFKGDKVWHCNLWAVAGRS